MTTCSSLDEAESLAEKLVLEKLAACVQILPQMRSVYFWEGEIKKDAECLLMIKTLADKYDAIETFIRDNHSYDVPEIVAIRAERVSNEYLKWLEAFTN